MSVILVLLVLGTIVGAVYYFVETTGGRDVRRTTWAPSQIIRQAVQEIGADRRWTATGHSSDFAAFTSREHASCGIAILISFIPPAFVLLGIIYMLTRSRTLTLTVNVFPEPDGTSSVQVSSNGGKAKARARRFLRSLPEQPGFTPQTSPGAALDAPAGAALPTRKGSNPVLQSASEATQALPAPSGRTPGWRTDPDDPSQSRWWDGYRLTEHTSAKGSQAQPTSATEPTDAPAGPSAGQRRQRKPLPVTPATAAQTTGSQPGRTVYCEHCGAEMAASHRFCPECGKQPREVV